MKVERGYGVFVGQLHLMHGYLLVHRLHRPHELNVTLLFPLMALIYHPGTQNFVLLPIKAS